MNKPGILLPLILKNLLKRPFTVLYPREQWPLPEGYRGIIVHNNETCIGCGLCSRICPAKAIEMIDDPEMRPLGNDRIRKVKPLFYLDRCMRCAQCEEYCPKSAIHLTGGVGVVAYLREKMRIFS